MEKKLPFIIKMLTYINVAFLIGVGYIFDILTWIGIGNKISNKDPQNPDFVPLFRDFESFYYRHIYKRQSIHFANPIKGPMEVEIELMDREMINGKLELNGKTKKIINTGSYNYFGFGGVDKICIESVINALYTEGISTGSSFIEYGQSKILDNLEKCVAKFLNVESSICFPMGFIANSSVIPTLCRSECAIFSDKLNHASTVIGCRSSEGKVFVFPHNNLDILEKMIKKTIIKGQPKTRRPWKMIFIFCEGIYSMEGNIVNLPKLIEIKKKYKTYLFIDEAHSIGAIGSNGRGIVDYYNCNSNDIDILMGTFSKSFGACGGYIAGKKNIIDYIRQNSLCTYYGITMPPPVVAQCLSSMNQIMDNSLNSVGRKKIKQLYLNTKYFREKLLEKGFFIIGDNNSPVVVLIIGLYGLTPQFAKFMRDNNIGVIIVGFPATPIDGLRCRFCISSNHTQKMLDYIIDKIDEFGNKYKIKYFKN